ncbi:MarR family winged helix-turn-helix transcriptional regulator [Maricaulis sp.]|uniref:MarR family winged helix-turn-helix transcriptional regulator n=1 Tax=Maricaulis sp. TaxID=1486257 RepID=UPI001B104182|nr:MarR family winged helix-turn-helix transcriptional regulator [Maricaulis sp.]MBO6797709.1 winged helix-turn-helix transcriptional regulator [Maricaulis sp.]
MAQQKLTDVVFKLSIDLGTQLEGSPELDGLDIPPINMRILRFLYEEETATPLAVAGTINRDRGHVTRLLQELSANGLIALKPNPQDGRSKLAMLTAKARTIFSRVHAAEARLYDRATQDVDKQELITFFKVAQKISSNLSGG